LNPLLHQPVRTRIVAFLAARGEATFNDLKKAIGITDGNLDAHMKKLVGAGYVETRREIGEGRPQTTYQLSAAGEAEFHAYVATLEALLEPREALIAVERASLGSTPLAGGDGISLIRRGRTAFLALHAALVLVVTWGHGQVLAGSRAGPESSESVRPGGADAGRIRTCWLIAAGSTWRHGMARILDAVPTVQLAYRLERLERARAETRHAPAVLSDRLRIASHQPHAP
jgi:DNA-binding transcriptional ArsR family regulator